MPDPHQFGKIQKNAQTGPWHLVLGVFSFAGTYVRCYHLDFNSSVYFSKANVTINFQELVTLPSGSVVSKKVTRTMVALLSSAPNKLARLRSA